MFWKHVMFPVCLPAGKIKWRDGWLMRNATTYHFIYFLICTLMIFLLNKPELWYKHVSTDTDLLYNFHQKFKSPKQIKVLNLHPETAHFGPRLHRQKISDQLKRTWVEVGSYVVLIGREKLNETKRLFRMSWSRM